MEISSILLIAAVGFAAVCGAIGIPFLYGKAADKRRANIAAGRTDGRSFAARILGRGIGPLKGVSRVALKIPGFPALIDELCVELNRSGYRTDTASLASVLVALLMFVTAVAYVATSSVAASLAVDACVLFGLHAGASKREERRRNEMREEIPEALQSMKACFQTGYSFSQTIHEISLNTKGPLSVLFTEVEGVLETGGGMHRALGAMRSKGSEPELMFLATALEIQHKTGGSMNRILEAARQSVVDEIELKRTLRTQTAQAKLSAQIVTLMPFVLIGVFSLLSPGFLDPFFESPLGILLLLVAFGMQMAGILLVRRMLKVGQT